MSDQSRAQRRRSAKRRRSGMQAGVAVAAIGVVAVILAFATGGGGLGRASSSEPPSPSDSPSPPPPVTLVAGTVEKNKGSDELVWLDLLSKSKDGSKGSIIYIPAHSAVEVPGRGLQDLADAFSTGGMPLLLSSAENLLGLRIAHYVVVSDKDADTLFTPIAPLSVDVPDKVETSVGKQSARVIFTPGLQRLPAPFITSLLYTVGINGDDQELGNRNLAFWDALTASFGSDPSSLVSKLASSGSAVESNNPFKDDLSLMGDILSLPSSERTLEMLPVDQVSVGGAEMYRADSDRVASFLDRAIGSVAPPDEVASLQVLNGNGVPGIGEKVSSELIDHGFRVVLSGNAPNFPHAKHSLIVMYGTAQADRKLAQQVKQILGVGQIQLSAQRQGIVDLTIVVGKDFLGKH